MLKSFSDADYPVVAVRSGIVIYQNPKALELLGDLRGSLWSPHRGDAFGVSIETKRGRRTFLAFRIRLEDDVYLLFDVTEQREIVESMRRELATYRGMIEDLQDTMVRVSASGTILFANPAVRAFGYEPSEVVGRHFLDFLSPEDAEVAEEMFNEFLRTGNFRRKEIRVRTKGGDVRWVDVVGTSVRRGEDVEILVIVRDVTDRVKLERELREREALYRTLVESSLAAIFVVQDDKVVYGNPEFERFTGYTREEWERQDAYVCFRGVGLADVARELVRTVLQGRVVRTVGKYVTRGGEVRYAEYILAPIVYNGRPAVLGNAVDITELKENERRLKRLNIALLIASDVNRVLSRHGFSPETLREIRLRMEEFLKVAIIVRYRGEVLREVSEGMEHALAVAEECFNAGRRVAVGDVEAFPIGLEGRVYGAMAVSPPYESAVFETLARDIAFAVRNAEVEEEKRIALEAILRNLRQFEELADRLRNPLAAILGYIEVRDQVGDSAVVEKVKENAKRIEAILDELEKREIETREVRRLLEED